VTFWFVTDFYLRLNKPQGLLWLEGLGKLKKIVRLIGPQTDDLLACGIVPNHYATTCPINAVGMILFD
jgi:hypothetical protein